MANDNDGIAVRALQGLPLDNMIGGPLAAAIEAQAAADRAQAEFLAAQAATPPAEPSEPDPEG